MDDVESEVDRCLTLLRNWIRERGFTQMDVQETLGWGRTYISQLLRKQKKLKVEQILLILDVIGIEPADFFGELYSGPGRRAIALRRLAEPAQRPWPELEELRGQVQHLTKVLVEKGIVTEREVALGRGGDS